MNTYRSPHRSPSWSPCGIVSPSTMIVMRMAMTPSLKASSRFFVMLALPDAAPSGVRGTWGYAALPSRGAAFGNLAPGPPSLHTRLTATSRLRSRGVQLQPQRLQHLQDGGELGITLRRERLVETLAAEPRFACDRRHAAGAGDVAQRRRHQSRVALVKRSLEVGGHVVARLQVLRCVPRARPWLRHHPSRSARAKRLALSMSRAWVRLSPPARSTSTASPNRVQ